MDGFGAAIAEMMMGMLLLCLLFIPLGMWKFIELCIVFWHFIGVG